MSNASTSTANDSYGPAIGHGTHKCTGTSFDSSAGFAKTGVYGYGEADAWPIARYVIYDHHDGDGSGRAGQSGSGYTSCTGHGSGQYGNDVLGNPT